jgi:2-C-methyl-D-erythritol 2,4-cyclodiphosphate synthase
VSPPLRIGLGVDAHAFAPGRRLVLGGVDVPHPLGLAGHSDADVLAHAVADAILGALALGDLGKHFPDTDPSLAGADSLDILRRVADLAERHGYVPSNVDAVVVAQEPRLAPHVDDMRRNLARALGAAPDRVSVKATTTEHLGFTGRKEGIAAVAVALLERRPT